jgi:ribonuclease HII
MLSARFKTDSIVEIGLDEAGRGSFWGPITAGAVSIPNESEWTKEQRDIYVQMRDSKKISPKKRVILAQKLKEVNPLTAIGIVHAHEINEKGITWANREAFRRAINGLHTNESCRLIIDGTLEIDDWKGEQEVVIEGDNKYIAVGAASILAKVSHDEWIRNYCKDHPECDERYHLISSNGYGTLLHREAIKLYGGHELHRDLYIQNWLPGTVPGVVKKVKNKKKEEFLIKF